MSLNRLDLPKLTGSDNYIIWSIRLQALLIKEELYDPIEKDSISNTNTTKNRKALAIIKLLCDDSPLLYIRDENSAKKAWETLRDIYNPKGFTTEYLILKEFFNTSLEGFDSMENYLNKVKLLIDDLRSKEIILPNQVIIAWILNSLDENYDSFVQNITQALRQDPLAYSVDSLVKSLIDESRGREESNIYITQQPYHPRVAKITKNYQNRARPLYKRSKKIWKNKPYSGKFCQNCQLTNHFTRDCFKLFPEKRPKWWNSSYSKGSKQNKQAKNSLAWKNNPSKPSEYSLANQKEQQSIINTILDDSTNNKQITRPLSLSPLRPLSEIKNTALTERKSRDKGYESPIKTPISTYPSQLDSPSNIPDLMDLEDQANISQDINMDIDFDKDDVSKLPSLYKNYSSNTNIGNLNLYNYQIGPKAVFIIDSGATVSAISKLEYFYSYTPTKQCIKWGKSINLPVKYKGSIIIRSNQNYIYIIHNILYIPNLGINILSLQRMNNIAIFTPTKVSLYRDKQITLIGNKENNLYQTRD